ncbi:hypothetical protein Pyn_31457 [Prunus yedoensis var. nudiflora]|uniref:Uncharacterized protein n=1 Tax=Prunus yedoensis var. nudiflora TaxID=2094558 RepID=A0A315B4L6_PRUYE|nr:hypothetical protein Pyn_31457 [Prunus yedoensis var. nudiflora]
MHDGLHKSFGNRAAPGDFWPPILLQTVWDPEVARLLLYTSTRLYEPVVPSASVTYKLETHLFRLATGHGVGVCRALITPLSSSVAPLF